MELLRVNECKLKVALTKEDLADFDLRAEELDYGNTDTKRMLWEILSRAKHAVGFDTDGARVLVQLFPCRSGGCEMYITRLGTPDDGTGNPREGAVTATSLHYKPSHHPPTGTGRPGAFGFDRMDRLITVCHRLRGIGYAGESEAYIGDDGRYYLFLEGLDPTGYLSLDEYTFIVEYGSAESVEALRGFLSEHGRAVCARGAVDRLGIL